MKATRNLFWGIALLMAAVSANAVDLTGRWVAEFSIRNNETSKMFFEFKQEGTQLTGTVRTLRGETPLQEGKVEGDTFSFQTVRKFNNGEMISHFQGTVVDPNLKIVMQFGQNNERKMEMSARKATPEDDAPPVSLPQLHDLPDNGLVRTPPMGWNSWNHFAGSIEDKTVREIADAMVETGMRDAGYIYVNIDDCWQGTRDKNGTIHPNEKFPDMKALADYVHGKGLKLGIYSSPGPTTCAGFAGSLGHEEQDAKTYAEWGIDYLKYDWCSAGQVFQVSSMKAVYQKMAEALRASGRPIVFSLCQYGMENVWEWGHSVGGNLWRTTGDIGDNWQSMSGIGFKQNDLAKWAGPGHWNDPDMLEVGNGGMTSTEYRTHMSLWAMLAAPLLAGNDIRAISKETLEILVNPEVIAIDQDALGVQGTRLSQDGKTEIWVKLLSGGRKAVALFNRGESPTKMEVRCDALGMTGSLKVRDVWAHEDRGVSEDGSRIVSEVPSHGTVLLVVGAS